MFTDLFCGFTLLVSVVRNLLGPISQLSPSFRSLILIYDWHERKQHPGNRHGRNRPRSLSASRAALRCNRIQLDAREAGPTSPVFFWVSRCESSREAAKECSPRRKPWEI